ncbi:hypothetical protein MNBD_GAMMA05-2032 [hydrothermal vent metagenome]|uniref:Phosphohistidine phosphatase SixA n=1 Tax=hydrothermal vent metagenome TaxID=652676 RepID=A0A3B0WI27_9ZZZZ
MFELLLMRHAKSDWHSHLADIERPLNERGRRDAARLGLYLEQAGLTPDRMVVSAAERTQETARLLLQAIPVAEESTSIDKSLYLADMETLCDNIAFYAIEGQRLLVLAHNPGMDYLVNYLAHSAPPLSDSGKLMTTCAVAYFHLDTLDALKKPGKGELRKLIRPKDIIING